MWEVVGKPGELELFEPFKPSEILYDFDGPRTFTHLDKYESLCLAHWFDDDEKATRYIVVPFTEELLASLKNGSLTLRDALNQPRIWLVDEAHSSGKLQNVWIVRPSDVPEDCLPKPGTMLLPSLHPLISLRAIGEEIEKGGIPGSVIRACVEGVQKAF